MAWPLTPSNFYRCTIESIRSGCITAWYGNCATRNRKAHQRVVSPKHHREHTACPSGHLQHPISKNVYLKAIRRLNSHH
ncbi:unnamed protein product [Oncorhynchus mykiss]|uniref:Uncharacterized protein n=1 Tax=Oncorhynchus mykiss TaxID=8022 RepID=A0A060W5G1_ONCMY|nr:unnamed protein product [Oncorhynchus mykiss]